MEKRLKTIKALKITGTIIYVFVTAFLLVMLLASMPDILKNENWGAALGGVIIMVLTLIVSAAYIIPIILGIVGLVLLKKIQGKGKVYFIFMIIVPPLTALINFLTYYIALTLK